MNGFVRQHFGMIAAATKAVESANNTIKEAVCVLLGYFDDGAADLSKNSPKVIDFPREQEVQQRTQRFDLHGDFAVKSLITEIKEMLIDLKLNGSVRERSNGLIEVRTQQFGSVYGRNTEEIRQKFQQKLNDLKSGKKPQKKQCVCLSEFYNTRYLPYKRSQNRSQSTLEGIAYNFAFIVEQNFDKPMNAYTPQLIEDFLFSIPQTRKRQIIQGLLNNIFNRAVALSVIKSNPCAPLDRTVHKIARGSAISFTDLKRFFTALLTNEKYSHIQKSYFIFVFLTGTRRTEALAAKIGDMDLQSKILQINGTKTDGSFRHIPLFPLAEALLQTLSPNTDDKYFAISDRTSDEIFGDIMKELGIKHKLHDLRHTFGTIQICCNKIDVKTVSIWMGHSTIDTTLRIYTHPEHLDKSVFLRGDLTESEKTAILKAEYAEIIALIDNYLRQHTQNVPKNQ